MARPPCFYRTAVGSSAVYVGRAEWQHQFQDQKDDDGQQPPCGAHQLWVGKVRRHVWWLERRGWHLSARTRVSDDVSGATFATYSGFMYVDIYRRALCLVARWCALLGPGGNSRHRTRQLPPTLPFPFATQGRRRPLVSEAANFGPPHAAKGGFCRSLDGMRLW